MKNKKTKKDRQKDALMIVGTVIAVTAIVATGWYEIIYDPIQEMIYFPFDNGTSKWLNVEQIVDFTFENGTTVQIPVLNATQYMDFEDFQGKVIHLKNMKTDYNFKHTDFIGSKTGKK